MLDKEQEIRFCLLRKKAVAADFKRMNDRQKEAVLTVRGPLLVLAGAGSGKTTVIVNRITNLIRYGEGSDSDFVPSFVGPEDLDFLEDYVKNEGGDEERMRTLCAVAPVSPYRILAITFTNKAANELKDRLARNLSEEEAASLWASTFHSCCVRILRRDGSNIGIERNFTIYDSSDSKRVIKDCIKEQNVDEKKFEPKSVLNIISNAKNEMLDAKGFLEKNEGDFRLKVVGTLYELYEKKLKAANALDFDDIIMKTVELLQSCPEVLQYYQNKFKHVLVDEYQDTNHSQYVLVSLLAGGYNNLCVVGDDDQSIYGFRGANIENILSFEEQFPGAKTIRLEQNYRSTKNILEAANHVIARNRGRKEKTLWTKNDEGTKVTVYNAPDDQTESRFIAQTILDLVKKEGRSFNDFAILYRMNAQSGAVERVFSKMGVPHRIIGGHRFYDRKEIVDMLAYLHVLHNPHDDLRLRRIINEPKRGIGDTTMETMQALATSLGTSIYELLPRAGELDAVKRAAPRLLAFYEMMEGLTLQKDTMGLRDYIELVMKQTDYLPALERQNDMESRGRVENLYELLSNALAYEKNNEQATLEGFLEEVALLSDIDNHDPEADAVALMTVHSAKGLEFPVVFIYGMEEGIFPSLMSINSEREIEEERRLSYVAITRAKERLYITHAAERILYGRTTYNPVSRFVTDIPKSLVEEDGLRERKPAAASGMQPSVAAAAGRSMFAGAGRAAAGGGAKAPQFQVGDMVSHGTFGAGMVVAAKSMGNDVFLEVAFDKVGTKKLMANFAKLTKL